MVVGLDGFHAIRRVSRPGPQADLKTPTRESQPAGKGDKPAPAHAPGPGDSLAGYHSVPDCVLPVGMNYYTSIIMPGQR
jgi:hypothetical protein